jgi:hypothetical protein
MTQYEYLYNFLLTEATRIGYLVQLMPWAIEAGCTEYTEKRIIIPRDRSIRTRCFILAHELGHAQDFENNELLREIFDAYTIATGIKPLCERKAKIIYLSEQIAWINGELLVKKYFPKIPGSFHSLAKRSLAYYRASFKF